MVESKNSTKESDDFLAELMRDYDEAISKASSEINWYETKRNPQKRWSRYLRIGTIVSVAVGTLCPLLDAAGISNWISNNEIVFGQFGYIAFALAGAFIGADKFFGISSGWMRYTITQQKLQKALTEFQYDWKITITKYSKDEKNSNQLSDLLENTKKFSLKISELVISETELWASEFQSNIARLEKAVNAKLKK